MLTYKLGIPLDDLHSQLCVTLIVPMHKQEQIISDDVSPCWAVIAALASSPGVLEEWKTDARAHC